MIEHNTLYDWQKDAFQEWNKDKKNIVQAPTGVGKTLFAMYCIQQVRQSTIIIVPTIVLMRQWKQEILEHLDVKEENVGLYYGEKKELKPITIAVINSVREEDLSKFGMVVCDEIHRYASAENIKPLKRSSFNVKLGITATLQREDGLHNELVQYIGSVCYGYRQKEAIEDGVLNKFTLINSGVDMPLEEKRVYDGVDMYVKENLRAFGNNFQAVVGLAKNYKHPDSRKASELMKKISTRRLMYSNCSAKIHRVSELVKKHKDDQVIIFNEFIGMAEQIYDRLVDDCVKVGIYHSNAKDLSVIKQFSDGKIKVLVAVKSLNEGLNVRNANVGIMVSANTIRRNTVQRLGRVIRKVEGKNAYFYQLYCKFTKESVDVQKRTALLSGLAEKVEYL